jgi:hypothetical protein
MDKSLSRCASFRARWSRGKTLSAEQFVNALELQVKTPIAAGSV